jgi:hypothetical protein
MPSVHGHCYCGAVEFTVDVGGEPIFAAYCHCDSCRRSHAAPLYQVVCVDDATFQVTRGQEGIVDFQKPGSRIVRAFCGTCGTRVYNRFPGWSPGGRHPVVFFPNTLDEATTHNLPESLRPRNNNAADECVLDLERLAPVLA